jgi:hydroxyacylglutathione hydrolase
MWAGSLISTNAKIVLIAATNAQVDEAVVRLARVGLDNVYGFLKGGIESWRSEGLTVAKITQVTVHELNDRLRQDVSQIIDVRRPAEYASGHVPKALTAPLSNLQRDISQLPLNANKPVAVICAGGYRSSAATSLLEQQGFRNLLNVSGGTSAWIKAGYEVERA